MCFRPPVSFLLLEFTERLTIYSTYFELKSQVTKNSLFTLFMTKVFDILLNPNHGWQMLRIQLQINLPELSKGYKNKFSQILERMGKLQQITLYVVSISEIVTLFTISMTKIIVGNGNCKRKNLNRDM